MHIGFHTTNIPDELPPDRIAREVSSRGFESLWCGEHSHIPVSREPIYRGGQKMPELYKSMMNPFLSLLLAATAADGLLLGTSVALPLEHDIFDLAKTAATLDHYSNGRFLFGVGVGWNKEELANHSSIPWSGRYRALAECVQALRCLWTDDEPEFHGQYYDFDAVWTFPKSRLPVLCGAGGRLGVQHAAEWADGWVPMDTTLGDVAGAIAGFRRAAYDAGRDAASIPVSLIAIGNPTLKTLAGYRELGVSRVIVGAGRSGWDDPAATLPFLDHYASMIIELSE